MMDKFDELCERLMGMPSVMAMRDAAAAIRELKAKVAGMESRTRVAEELLADSRQAASERLARAERAESELAKIKGHAEAMAYGKGTVAINAMVAYRADFPKE